MAQNIKICEISTDLIAKLKSFRFRKEKNIAAIILKIDQNTQQVVEDEYLEEDCTIEDIQEQLPGHLPRYIILSYVREHSDGRVSYPLCFIYYCPSGLKPEIAMMYAASRNMIHGELGMTKDFELQNVEDLTEEWLEKKLSLYR